MGNAGLNPAATDTSASSTAATADEKELRAVPAEQFGGFKGQGLSNTPVPIAGDKVLPQSIQDTFAAGKEAPVPLILGDFSSGPSKSWAQYRIADD